MLLKNEDMSIILSNQRILKMFVYLQCINYVEMEMCQQYQRSIIDAIIHRGFFFLRN